MTTTGTTQTDDFPPVEQRLENILSKLSGVQKGGNGQYYALCPCHDDTKQSLGVKIGDNRGILIECLKGCPTPIIATTIGYSMRYLRPDGATRSKRSADIGDHVATYEYRDENGNVAFQVLRYEKTVGGKVNKTFRQRQPNGKGGWKWSIKGVRVLPYRLPGMLAADPQQIVWNVEGEKDADRLTSVGLVATCNPMGAKKWRAEHAAFLQGRHVVIIPDNDNDGREHANQVAGSLAEIAASVRILQLDGLSEKGDVSNWLDLGNTVERLQQLASETQPISQGDLQALAEAHKQSSFVRQPTAYDAKKLPQVIIQGDDRALVEVAEQLGDLIGNAQQYFRRGRSVSRISNDDGTLYDVRPENLVTGFEQHAELIRLEEGKKGPIPSRARCSKGFAESILRSDAFIERLPMLHLVSRSPVLVDRNGELIEVAGYDQLSGVFAQGEAAEQVALDESRELLRDLLAGFRFATEADYSRALAAMITPALVMGGLIPGRAPIDLGEADQSQTGKGYRNRLTAAIYNCVPRAITTRKGGGVGSIEESFDRALIAGEAFIALDNVRGAIDSPAIESFCTEDSYYARSAYSPVTLIDPRRVALMFTSNRADMTTDLANRSSCVRILKQHDGYQFKRYPEGDILSHVRENQPKYLGAVFAVVRAWHAAGKPRSNETRHDFRAWVQILDWIVQNIFGCVPLMDGHRETQRRMTNPAMNWLRDVGLAVLRSNYVGLLLQAHDLIEILCADGSVEVPSLGTDDIEDDAVSKRVLQQFGKRMKRCFADSDSLTIDQVVISREQYQDSHGQRFRYRVVSACPETRSLPSFSPDEIRVSKSESCGNSATTQQAESQEQTSPDSSPDAPLMVPLIVSRSSPDSLDSSYRRIRDSDNSHVYSVDISPNRVSIGNHQGIKGNQGGIKGNQVASGECPHDEHKRELDPTLPGYTRISCAQCGQFITYEAPKKEAAAA